MNEQINLRLPPKLLHDARKRVSDRGYPNVQALIEEAIREKLYDEDELNPKELEFLLKVLHQSKKKNLFGTEQDLWNALNPKKRRSSWSSQKSSG